ncbi:MAG: ATP-binding protein [Chloroflexota bacterium]|nr:MAG: ATP-binding protein [Chloroflexota bacterium]
MNQTDFPEVEESQKSETEILLEQIQTELEQARQANQEIQMLFEQSELEVNKLTERNASATGTLQRVQSQFERLPREEIRLAYDTALDAQQRLFVVRGQVEKLQSEKKNLQRQIELLEMIEGFLSDEQFSPRKPQNASATTELLEMLIQAQEAERLRLSRQMHDGPAQALSNLILETEIAMRLFDVNKEEAYQELGSLRDSASNTFQQVRDFIFELRPMMLDDLGLIPTVKKYTSAIGDLSAVPIKFGVTGSERRLEPFLEVMIFRSVQELMRNAINHSQANQIEVQINVDESFVNVIVEDDGTGFDVQNLEEEKGMGLKLIKERVEMASGEFNIDSQVGEGTRVSFKVPDSVLGVSD